MKKILLLAFAATALFFTACSSDDDNPTRDEQLKQRLVEVGTWKNYGAYKVTREMLNGKYKYDTTFVRNSYGDGTYLYKFTEDTYTIIKPETTPTIYDYYIKNDTLYSDLKNSTDFDIKRQINLKGDSCSLIGNWDNDDYHLIYVLHSK